MQSVTELTPLTVFLCVAVMMVAGLVHGTMGLGFPIVATPILCVFLDVRLAIVLTLLPVVVVNIASVVTSGVKLVEIRPFLLLAFFAVIGTIVGARLLIVFDPEPFKLVLALLIVLWLSANYLFSGGINWIDSRPRTAMVIFGFAAGVAAGSTNVMVAVLIIYVIEIDLPRDRSVAVLNFCFLSGKLTQIATFASAGLVSLPIMLTNVGLASVALVSLLAGVRLGRNIALDSYRQILRLMLGILAVVLIGQYVVHVVSID